METIITSIAEQNAERVRQGYEAFNKGDIETLSTLFHENVSWHTPGKSPVAGDHKGMQGTFAQFGRYGAETHGTFRAILKDVAICSDGTIIGIHKNTGTRNGKELNVDCCIIFQFRDGKVISGTEYFFDLHAWDTFWL